MPDEKLPQALPNILATLKGKVIANVFIDEFGNSVLATQVAEVQMSIICQAILTLYNSLVFSQITNIDSRIIKPFGRG